jgi:Ala-tRNA(Pro) deacylase
MEKAPDSYKSHLQETVYESLTKLQIPFERVSTDEAISKGTVLKMKMVKTMFLCNSKKTEFYNHRR